jgi:ferredoxin
VRQVAPELVALDEWGYPILADGAVPANLARHARHAITLCPRLALTLAPRRPIPVRLIRTADDPPRTPEQ